LNNLQIRWIIAYCSKSWEHRVLDYIRLHGGLKLEYSAETLERPLERRLKEAGYFCCEACQKPYLTLLEANNRMIWGLGYIFWCREVE
jgi:hypothetical protein